MANIKKYLTLLCMFFFLLACTKKERQYSVTGRMVYKDNKEPVKKVGFSFCIDYVTGSFTSKKTSEKSYLFVTDDNGGFTVSFNSQEKRSYRIGYECGSDYLWFGGQTNKKSSSIDAGTIEIDRK